VEVGVQQVLIWVNRIGGTLIYKYKISKEMLKIYDEKGKIKGYRSEKEMIGIINSTFGLNRVVTGLVIS